MSVNSTSALRDDVWSHRAEQQFGAFSVTALDAGHCPGSLMFILTGKRRMSASVMPSHVAAGQGRCTWKDIYTGDFRLTPEQIDELTEQHLKSGVKLPAH